MGDEFKKLFVVIGTKTDEFRKGLKDVEKGLNKFKGIADISLGVGAAITGGIGMAVKQYSDLGSQVYDMSKRTGLGAKAISVLKYAADQNGTSIEGLEVGWKRWQVTLAGALKGEKAATQAFKDLGIPAEEFTKIPIDEQLNYLADAFAEIEDPVKRTDLAVTLFGRAGTDLLPILTEGSRGMEQYRQEAEKTGRVFTDEGAAKADKFGDSIDMLKASFQGIALTVADKLIPALQPYIDKVTVIIGKMSEWVGQHPELVNALLGLGIVLVGAGGLFYAIKSVVDVLKAMAVAMTLVQSISGVGLLKVIAGLAAGGVLILGINEMLKTPEAPTLQSHAQGGIAWTPQISALAENGPEAIIPLSKMGGGQEIHTHVYLDGEQIAESVDRAIYNRSRYGGA